MIYERLIYNRLFTLTSMANKEGSDEGKIIGGYVGDLFDGFYDELKAGFVDFFQWLGMGIFEILSPFIEWGCKSAIVICIIIFYCSNDKTAISKGLKYFFIYLIYIMLRGAIT